MAESEPTSCQKWCRDYGGSNARNRPPDNCPGLIEIGPITSESRAAWYLLQICRREFKEPKPPRFSQSVPMKENCPHFVLLFWKEPPGLEQVNAMVEVLDADPSPFKQEALKSDVFSEPRPPI